MVRRFHSTPPRQKAVEKNYLIGPEQSGFRANRSCSDNTFILNSILEMNKSKRKLSYLLFVDLKEAYDRVDRNILFARLQQLKFPDKTHIIPKKLLLPR